MAATSTPYGLKPVAKLGGGPDNGGGVKTFIQSTNSATAIYVGNIVAINSGNPVSGTASPTTTRGTSTPVGVCVGIAYNNVVAGAQPPYATYLPANAVNSGYTNIQVMVADDPSQVFQIQASGSVTRANIGSNAALTNFGGSTTTGLSSVQLDQSSIATTNTLAVRIVDLVDNGGTSVPGDAYTDCLVVFNQGVHAYRNATGG